MNHQWRVLLHDYNLGVVRARHSYEREPFALTLEGTRTCSRCRGGQHGQCTGSTRHRRDRACACWVKDHGR